MRRKEKEYLKYIAPAMVTMIVLSVVPTIFLTIISLAGTFLRQNL